jgi:ACT domain-containing protein
MSKKRLYIVHGMGPDAVGLVGHITTPIGKAGGNILDQRQDVLHGLFTIFLVVDLADSGWHVDELTALVKTLSEETGLSLRVDPYHPVPRSPDKKNLLMILVGHDKPGIISSISATLGKYRANIEFSKTIAREGIFLMELLTDTSNCSLPMSNLMALVDKQMQELSIQALYQTEDVFNKKRRVILFDYGTSLMPRAIRREILEHTGIDPATLAATYAAASPRESVTRAAALLEGFPLDVLTAVIKATHATPDTMELCQTLKVMGYKLALSSPACSLLTGHVKETLGFDHCFGVDFEADDDARSFTGQIAPEQWTSRTTDRTRQLLEAREQVAPEDITVLSDAGLFATPGLELEWDLERILNLYNDHIVDKDKLLGLLGSFGTVD